MGRGMSFSINLYLLPETRSLSETEARLGRLASEFLGPSVSFSNAVNTGICSFYMGAGVVNLGPLLAMEPSRQSRENPFPACYQILQCNSKLL